jgi:hypothetical protein
MRFKSGFLVGLSAGYVLGTKAGQERYQQIVDAASKLKENPGVQRLTGEVNKTVSVSKDRVAETATAKAGQAKEAVATKADQAKEAVASKVGNSQSSTSTTT